MSESEAKDRTGQLVFEYEFEAPPEKVWRAVCSPEFRRKWLPDDALADPEPVSSVPGQEICYRMVDDAPPFFDSMVTFQIEPGAHGGTLFRIVHRLTDVRLRLGLAPAANSNGQSLMRAA